MIRSLRVLYLLRYYPTLTETFVVREIAELVRRGHRVTVVAMGTRSDSLLVDGLPEVSVWRPPCGVEGVALPGAVLKRWSGGSRRVFEALGAKAGARVHWVAARAMDGSFDWIHAHFAGESAEWAQAVSSLIGVPYSVTVHAVDLFKPRGRTREVLLGADRVITVSEYNRAHLQRVFGVAALRIRCGVEPTVYPTASPGDEAWSLVSVGRWVPKKGLDLLMEAVRVCETPWRLRIIGDVPSAAAGSGVQVGSLPPSLVPSALARAQLFALPCRVAEDGDRDGVPVSIMEAMACGLPVLTTDVAGIGELVDDSVGWLLPSEHLGAIVRCLDSAARDPRERARRGAAARDRIISGGWTVTRQIDELLEAWRV